MDWYPWGPEAFERARREDKPIFVSVGYSTCYWCHVMERESFEDEATAALMNEHFISIKVDREERPDVDDIYMAAVQTLAGRGGWPMSVFLEPQTLKPFMGGTYFPPEPRYGKPAFKALLRSIADQWQNSRPETLAKADQVAGSIHRRLSAGSRPQAVGPQDVDRAVTLLLSGYDSAAGGFSKGRPKFPQPVRLELVMGAAWDNPVVRSAVVHTLDRMAMGGIYDQIGGGFHRYSTDRNWLVPHFEKMLYDNAQLASVYAKAYELTGDDFYARIARETLDYVLREMTGPQGAFYSAQDAEVDGREGGSYVWTPGQVRRALEAAGLDEEIDFALDVYGLNRGVNFRDPHHPTLRRNVLYLARRPDAAAQKRGITLEEFNRRLDRTKEALLAARNERDQPATDDKVITAWAGLMIAAMVDGARALQDPRYLEAARRSARFVLGKMRTQDGGLRRTYRAQEAKIEAFSIDYALFVRALLALHRSAVDPSGESPWLEHAVALTRQARDRFWDEARGGYFDTLPDQADLFVRTKSMRDGVMPCANSVMLLNLLDLEELTGEAGYLDDAGAVRDAMSGRIRRSATGVPLAVLGLHRLTARYPQRAEPPPAPAPPAAATRPTPTGPVQVATSTSTVRVPADAPAEFEITLDIAEGYHVNAHEPGLDELIGLRLHLVGLGFELEVRYPPGEAFRTRAFETPISVHTGRLTIPVSIKQTQAMRTEPRIVLTYQVCTDELCLRPARVVLPVRILAESDAPAVPR